MNKRKLAILRVTPETFIELCKPGEQHFKVTGNALPEDARVYGVGDPAAYRYTPHVHAIDIVLTSESFEEIPEGNILPVLPPPIFERII